MSASERIADLIAQHVPAPGRMATRPGPGSVAPPPLPTTSRQRTRSSLAQAVDVTAHAVADDDDGRDLRGGEHFAFLRAAWSKSRRGLNRLGWPRREVLVRAGIAVISLGLGLLLGARPWHSPAPTSNTRTSGPDPRSARSTAPPTKRADRATLTTAGATVTLPVERSSQHRALGNPRKVSPVRIQAKASAPRSSEVPGRADKRKAPANLGERRGR